MIFGGLLFTIVLALKLAVFVYPAAISVGTVFVGVLFYHLAYRTRTVLTLRRIIYVDSRSGLYQAWGFGQIDKITRFGNEAWAWFRVHIESGEQVRTSHLPEAKTFWNALPSNLCDPRSDELTRKHNILAGTYGVLLLLSIVPFWLTAVLLPIHILQSLEVCPKAPPKELFYPLLIGGLPLSFLVGSFLSGLVSIMVHKRSMSRSEARSAFTDSLYAVGNSTLGRLVEWTVVRPLSWTVDLVYRQAVE